MAAGREDIVVSPLVQMILDKLASPLLREFGSIWDVQEELCDITDAVGNIQAMLDFAEQRQIKDKVVKLQLKNLKLLAYYIDDTLDKFIYEAHRNRLKDGRNETHKKQIRQYFSFSLKANQMLSRHEIAPMINDIKEKLVDIEKKLEPHYLAGAPVEIMEKSMQTIQYKDMRQKSSSSLIDDSYVFGRRGDVSDVKNILLGDRNNEREVSVVAIVGMGGLGKTTLSQLVYNDPDVEKHFDVRAWVCVSIDFSIERVTREILESATKEPCDLKSLDPLQGKLQDVLREKRFLIMLDDVWSEDHNHWDDLRKPFRVGKSGSRIIVTTRSHKTSSSIVDTIHTLFLQVLSNEDCWLLMKKCAFVDKDDALFSNLEEIGLKIANKCSGLPLAANAIGGLLRFKLNEKEWEAILESDIWDLEVGINILSALSLSYHYLPAHLKQCFAYSSLFPKDYQFDKEDLVRMWMAEGFFRSEQVDRMEDIGGEYFDDLCHRFFFQQSKSLKSRFVMHDLIHDLAQLVSGDIYGRLEGGTPRVLGKKAHQGYDGLINKEFYGCQDLSTLLSFTIWVRVLDLSDFNIKVLPDCIGDLKYLRYLDLSDNPLRELPESIGNLYYLQTLILKGCGYLEELPRSMGNLINLQHLLTGNWYELGTTIKGIKRLNCLKTLPFFFVGRNDDTRIGELKELQHLQGSLCIMDLQNVVDVNDAKEANLKNKEQLDELELKWGGGSGNDGDAKVFEGLQPSTKLKRLKITSYSGLGFPKWMMMDLPGYNKLVNVTLNKCKRCEILPPLGKLPLLESLEIGEMNKVNHVGHEFYGDDRTNGFRSLKFLKFSEMTGLKEWYGAEEGEFPCLQSLKIWKCHRLRKLPPFLPTVKKLYIGSCSALATLPRLPSISTLKLSNCDEKILSWLHHCTSLSFLYVSDFHNSMSLPPAMLVPLAGALERFEIKGFNMLVSLSEDVGLQRLACLKCLVIERCYSLTSLPVGLHNLTVLMDLTIENCGSLMSLPEEGLPSTLNRFCIINCRQLEFLPKGLRNLSSLKELKIYLCDNLMSLPEEGLPTSLRILDIRACAEPLMTRCQKGREDWPKIAHIPEVILFSRDSNPGDMIPNSMEIDWHCTENSHLP